MIIVCLFSFLGLVIWHKDAQICASQEILGENYYCLFLGHPIVDWLRYKRLTRIGSTRKIGKRNQANMNMIEETGREMWLMSGV